MNKAPNKYWVILFRRAMVRLSCIIAKKINAKALVTGENVGQVASQTLSNINVVSEPADIPILRPLIGYNKKEIINLATKIKTYEISILPYEDCCGFFVPKHPETKAKIDIIKDCEKDPRSAKSKRSFSASSIIMSEDLSSSVFSVSSLMLCEI